MMNQCPPCGGGPGGTAGAPRQNFGAVFHCMKNVSHVRGGTRTRLRRDTRLISTVSSGGLTAWPFTRYSTLYVSTFTHGDFARVASHRCRPSSHRSSCARAWAATRASLAAAPPSHLQHPPHLADPGANLGVLPPTSRAHAPPPELSGWPNARKSEVSAHGTGSARSAAPPPPLLRKRHHL